MFKHPWLLKNYRFSDNDQADRNANCFYWTCLIITGLIWGWFGFWLHYNEIGAQTHPALAIPGGVMLFLFVLLIGGHFYESLPRKWKYVAGCLMLWFSISVTDPIGMLTY